MMLDAPSGQGLPPQTQCELWHERTLLCRWLSTLLAKELDEVTLKAYLQGEAEPLLELLRDHAQLTPLVERFNQALNALRLFEQPRLELAADFATLFLMDGRTSAPPYASLYQPGQALFHQQPTERMEMRLRAAGYDVVKDFGEPADHLAVMLDYLATGYERLGEASSDAECEEIKGGLVQFVDEELTPWLPTFAQRCQQIDTASDFYPALAQLVAGYCATLSTQSGCRSSI
ncbi:molecular chaperone TorD [Halomonas sp. M20]|uniref:molecular chaperone TorD n=1 Tax=Halomonas sp. M20 TaxID=2763264 RepID=UPI001D0A35F2|nr:molecular chaperone TorD [Halomonas sp. M20]